MFEKILIANRGAIAVRIERTLKKMGIISIAVYAKADQDSLHVENADETVYIGDGSVKDTYLNEEVILDAAVRTGAQAIHPGYGFLSENASFAEKCKQVGITFIGPEIQQIICFGQKHRARAIARKAGIPLLPGTELLSDVSEAVKEAEAIGYPVILKSTAGGGGIGMQICNSEEELIQSYDAVCHMAESNFKDAGVFLEKYITRARHVEVQIFGNGYGETVTIGERDCSVQRRNQKVIEECPAPNLSDAVREKMYAAAQRLAETVSYRSAGTIEFLYDEQAEKFYFLEVNTRLQVEHGITEEVYGIDLVEWMVKEAAGELRNLQSLIPKPFGHALEARVYAEDCMNEFRPGTGNIDAVYFSREARVETWIDKGVKITSRYDPMLAKLIVYGKDREETVEKMQRVLQESGVYGVVTNMQYLEDFLATESCQKGNIHTGILKEFAPKECALEVLDGGVQTTVQDYPGMIGYWCVGVPPCGPMDDYDFRMGNRILGNPDGAAGLELTLRGGCYRFRTDTSFCITGADMHAALDEVSVPMYEVVHASALQVLSFQECRTGMRTYLLIAGGIDVPEIMGSRSTFIDGRFGGHNGRPLRTGDVLQLNRDCRTDSVRTMPEAYRPGMTNCWTIGVIPGPQPTPEYLDPEYLHTLTTSEYEVNFNSARTGIRLNGPIPQWVREDGGEAGLHPSNIHDNAYAVGTLDLTGDQSILLGPDGPSLGGFVCSVTTAKGEMWKLGQLHPGDKVHFQLLSLEQAAAIRMAEEKTLRFEYQEVSLPDPIELDYRYAILAEETAADTRILLRLDGEDNILAEYGDMELNIALRFRVHILMQELQKKKLPILELTPGIRSLQVHFDVDRISMDEMKDHILETNRSLPELSDISVPSRIIRLPLSWDDPQTQLAAQRYQQTVRPNAPWCPSNPEFIRRINGFNSVDDVKRMVFDANYLVLGLGDVYLGAPVATPIDPRHRMVTTKYNPARPWTPENAVGIGGAYLCVYGMEGPGGYQFVGRTIQMWNSLKVTKYFKQEKPWLLDFFDQIQFYPVSAEELLKEREDFIRGRFDIQIEQTNFHLGEYEAFLKENEASIRAFKEHQEASFEAERQMWKEKGLDEFDSQIQEAAPLAEVEIPDDCEPIKADIPGSVWKVLVKEGQKVKEGETVMILESMKMEFPIQAGFDGVIRDIYVRPGEQVHSSQLAASICRII